LPIDGIEEQKTRFLMGIIGVADGIGNRLFRRLVFGQGVVRQNGGYRRREHAN
jgi:hypothetical protein